MGQFQKLIKNDKWKVPLLLGIFGGCVAQLLFYLGWETSSANTTFLLGKTTLLFSLLFAVLFYREKITFYQGIGIFIMLIGVYFVSQEEMFETFYFAKGDIMIILSSALFGLTTLFCKKKLGKIPINVLVIGRHFLATIFFWVLMLCLNVEMINFGAFKITHFYNLFVFCLLQNVILLALKYKCIRKVPLKLLSIISLASPALGVLFNYLLLGEVITISHLCGITLIILGMASMHLHIHKTNNHHHIFDQRHASHVKIE